ncbi:MAG TPA: DUF368 domain-containing protein [Phaeodactylibacter sp.]|nr:DUF368 domain-containing protein [Phaeodactylibacter sp.]
MTKHFPTLFKGMAMGMAEVIPGVSGGTIAFITGIYEPLLNAIKSIGPEAIAAYHEGGIAATWKAINGTFLLALGLGMGLGIVVGVFGISYLLEQYPPTVWAFFFGLIVASAVYIARQLKQWSYKEIIGLAIGTAVAYAITVVAPAEGSQNLLFVFVSGVLAISALILPGISGSFILLLMGMYTYILHDTLKPALQTFATDKLMVMFVFALGCLTGLMTVSRLLSWTFKNYRSATLATLTGFMLGSLNKIWPWRNPIEWLRDYRGNIILNEEGLPKKVLLEQNVLPADYNGGDPLVVAVMVLFVLGFVTVFALERMSGD